MVLQLLLMSAVLGIATFGIGIMPLSYHFSKSHLEKLSILGIGLLLGSALGVIIPEGLEVISESHPGELPTGQISLSLIIGFVLMLIVEQLSSGAHSHTAAPTTECDAELGDLDKDNQLEENRTYTLPPLVAPDTSVDRERAFALLLGLVFHAAADGLALGVANLAVTAPGTTEAIPVVVFLALILHRAPTTLAFATSLLSMNVPRPESKKYLLIFSIASPCGAIASYALFSFFGGGNKGNLIGNALLVSGGTFLYVATVLQPVSHHSIGPGEMRPASRVLLISIGMFIPLLLSSLFGHGH